MNAPPNLTKKLAPPVTPPEAPGCSLATRPANDNAPPIKAVARIVRSARELVREDIAPETEARFLAKLVRSDAGCLLWTGAVTTKGYGSIGWKPVGGRARSYLVHRVAWVLAGNELDPTLTLDHLCRTKLCADASHLEQVTAAVNTRRYADTITHCQKGHELAGDNVRTSKRGKRVCVTCARASTAAWSHKSKRWLKPERKEYMRRLKQRQASANDNDAEPEPS